MIKKNNPNLAPFLRFELVKKLIGECPLCHFHFKTFQAKILDESKNAQLIHMRCQKCRGSIMILAISSGPLISSFCFITDLTEEDFAILKNNEPISQDDVLEFYQEFSEKNFCQNFFNNK